MIELSDVWKRFGDEWVLRGVNLRIDRPDLIAVVGENGSGKTTLLKIICGIVKPSRGTVKLFGKDLRRDRSYKRKIGVLFHENVLYEELTVDENLNFYSKVYGIYSDTAREVYERLELERFGDVRVKDLSFGWRKRANLVRALINDPKVVLLDEPLSGLDERSTELVRDLMLELSKDRIVLFTSPRDPEFECHTLRIEKGVLHDTSRGQGF